MTLVLPYGADQIGNSTVFSGGARNSNMPCVFDGEALDFESALMTDWNSDINVYETSADDFSTRSPSGEYRLKLHYITIVIYYFSNSDFGHLIILIFFLFNYTFSVFTLSFYFKKSVLHLRFIVVYMIKYRILIRM